MKDPHDTQSHAPEPTTSPPRQEGQQRVLEAEILGPDDEKQERSYAYYQAHGQGAGGRQVFGQVFMGGMDQRACLSPAISFFLFLVCVVQFGLLAGIGFAVFMLLGNVVGSVVRLRMMMEGRASNPWLWRAGTWLVSFWLTAWLAGGLD